MDGQGRVGVIVTRSRAACLVLGAVLVVVFASTGLAGGEVTSAQPGTAQPSSAARQAALAASSALAAPKRPTVPTGLRVRSSAGSTLIAWEPSVARRGVVGYDVYLDSRRTRTRAPALQVRGLACGRVVPARVVAIDAAGTRSTPMRATIQVPGCSTSRPGWVGGFETGDLSQWDFLHAASSDRFRVVTSDAGITPRHGSHMARAEVRGNEPASWSAATNVALIEKNSGPDGSGQLGADTYVGFSVLLPKGFPYVPNHLANNIAEWHGNSNAVQASVHLTIDSLIGNHFGISNPRPGFVLDLHTESGYRPAMFRFGDLVTGRWVDFVFRTRWATDSTGIVEGWMDGVKRFSSSRRTWYAGGQITNVKPQLGYYRANYSETAVLYLDAYKIGSSYESVAP